MSLASGPRIRPYVGVGAMIMRDNKILLGMRKGSHGKDTYGWCGGHLEFAETIEECIRREVFEETGLYVRSQRFLCVSNILSYGMHYVDIEFLVTVRPGEPCVLEPHKVVGWDCYDVDKLPAPLFEPAAKAIRSYRDGRFYNP